jgi:hypothetical protein
VSGRANALARLQRLSASGASGELIVADDEREVHVYLQAGRVAWGTSSAEPMLFSRSLRASTRLEEATLRWVYEECRRARRPLGEALISGGHATFEEVRGALAAQIRSSLDALLGLPWAQTVFLTRPQSYSNYDPTLTFPLTAFGLSERPVDAGPRELLERLASAIDGVTWSAVLSQASLVEGRGPVPPLVGGLESLLSAQARLVSVRTARASMLGVALAQPGGSLWCGVGEPKSFGQALGFLIDQLPPPVVERPSSFSQQLSEVGPIVEAEVEAVARRALGSVACPAGLAIVAHGQRPWAVSSGGEAGGVALTALSHQRVLDSDLGLEGVELAGDLRAEGTRRSAMVADERAWWFGVQLASREPRCAWLTLPRTAERTLGWALLKTLARDLSKAA